MRLPELGENIEIVDVSAVLVSVGDVVQADQPVIEVETEKASLEVPASQAGRIKEIRVKAGDKLKVGEVILVVESAAGETTPATAAVKPQPEAAPPDPLPSEDSRSGPAPVVEFKARPPSQAPTIGETVPAAPSVRALARELGVDVREVRGTGAGGRISRDDVKAHAKRLIGGMTAAAALPAEAKAPLPDFERWGEVTREPLPSVRRATALRLAQAWAAVPHVTQFDRADVTQLEAMRKRFNERPEAAPHKLTITAMAVKLAAIALERFPRFNASLDLAAGEIVLKRYIHVGVAVDTERGLLVPVIRDAGKKRLLDLAGELNDLASRARSKKIMPEELRGATFTISNLGGLGTTYFSPIVNWPEVAILGLGRSEIQAIHQSGGFEPRLILPLSLSYDHRLIDGAAAARFLRFVAEALEQPLLLLLDAPA